MTLVTTPLVFSNIHKNLFFKDYRRKILQSITFWIDASLIRNTKNIELSVGSLMERVFACDNRGSFFSQGAILH